MDKKAINRLSREVTKLRKKESGNLRSTSRTAEPSTEALLDNARLKIPKENTFNVDHSPGLPSGLIAHKSNSMLLTLSSDKLASSELLSDQRTPTPRNPCTVSPTNAINNPSVKKPDLPLRKKSLKIAGQFSEQGTARKKEDNNHGVSIFRSLIIIGMLLILLITFGIYYTTNNSKEQRLAINDTIYTEICKKLAQNIVKSFDENTSRTYSLKITHEDITVTSVTISGKRFFIDFFANHTVFLYVLYGLKPIMYNISYKATQNTTHSGFIYSTIADYKAWFAVALDSLQNRLKARVIRMYPHSITVINFTGYLNSVNEKSKLSQNFAEDTVVEVRQKSYEEMMKHITPNEENKICFKAQ